MAWDALGPEQTLRRKPQQSAQPLIPHQTATTMPRPSHQSSTHTPVQSPSANLLTRIYARHSPSTRSNAKPSSHTPHQPTRLVSQAFHSSFFCLALPAAPRAPSHVRRRHPLRHHPAAAPGHRRPSLAGGQEEEGQARCRRGEAPPLARGGVPGGGRRGVRGRLRGVRGGGGARGVRRRGQALPRPHERLLRR